VSSELRETPDGILEFWFEGAAEDPSKAMQRSAFWFQARAGVDEDILVQRAGIELFEGIVDRASTEWEPSTRGSLDFARRHLEIIERFGRFPHRNDVLGRESTAAEQAYLADGGESFGQ